MADIVGVIFPADPVKAAQEYIKKGWAPVPVPFGEKGPKRSNWQNFRTNDSHIVEDFTNNNIGLLTGGASGNIHDLDLDCDEAVALAEYFLPETNLVGGRIQRPNSHLYYGLPSSVKYQEFLDPDYVPAPASEQKKKFVLFELRGNGHQTLVAPSRHPSGDTYVWNKFGTAGRITDIDEFNKLLSILAAACLILRRWKEGARHHITNALTAVLYRSSWNAEDITYFIRAIATAADDDQLEGRLRCIPVTIEKVQQIANGETNSNGESIQVTGWPKLREYLGESAANSIGKWLQLDTKPVIYLSTDLAKMRQEALRALITDKDVYTRDHHLIYIVKQKNDGIPYIADLPKSALKEKLATVAIWKKRKETKAPKEKEEETESTEKPENKKETTVKKTVAKKPDWVLATPAKDTVDSIHEWENWPGLRPLLAITETPTLLRNHQILVEPGYDIASEILYRPIHDIPVPHLCDHEDAMRARDRLLDLVKDFPFPEENKPAYLAAWMSLLITPFVRYSFDAPAPLFAIDANSPAAGKTLLTRLTCTLAYGRKPPVTGWPNDEEERRKLITACLSSGFPVMFLDNVTTPLNGTALNRLLTNSIWQDRILGVSRVTTLPAHAIVLATGNNLTFGTETIRRAIHIRLETSEENPQERSNFTQPDIEEYVARERIAFVQCVLTLIAAYEKAKCPRVRLVAMGSFEEWSYIRQLLHWIGMEDPLKTQKILNDSNNGERSELAALIAGIEEITKERALTTAEMLNLVSSKASREVDVKNEDGTTSKVMRFMCTAPLLEAALQEHPIGRSTQNSLPTPKELAGRLRRYLHRVCGGKMIASTDVDRRGIRAWKVDVVTS